MTWSSTASGRVLEYRPVDRMLELVAVALVYAGGFTAFVGLAGVVGPVRFLGMRRRRAGALILGAGLAGAMLGFALPAPLVRVEAPHTRLDAVMPAYHFHEVHAVRVHAPPARILEAVHAVTAGEIRLFRTLTWIRSPRLGGGGRESILNAPEDQPILDVALRSGFVRLGDEPGREVVFGTDLRLGSGRSGPPRYARTAMNFLVEDEEPGWCRLGTETRVFGTDDGARRRFAAYWRVIYPGSALIRRTWLQAIKRRAEAS
jgi:hypothetical protein